MGRVISIVAILAMALGLLLAVIAVGIPYWEVNDVSITTKDNIRTQNGLWLKCTSYGTGNWECDDYNTFFLALPSKLQAARGLCITAMMLSLIAIVICVLALTGACEDGMMPRVRMNAIGGMVSFVAAICMFAAPSWYAYDLYWEYNFQMARAGGNPNNVQGRLMVFGSALFVAWGAGGLLLIASLLACIACCGSDDENDRRQPYTYKADRVNTVSNTRTEYV